LNISKNKQKKRRISKKATQEKISHRKSERKWKKAKKAIERFADEDTKALLDACAKDYLLSSHVVNNPSKVRELPSIDSMAECADEELDLWPLVGSLYGVVILESDELANSICLVARK